MQVENQIIIHHQDGNLVFNVIKGGYCLENGLLSVSVESESIDDVDFPDCALFCIIDVPVSGKLKEGDTFSCQRSGYDYSENQGRPRTYSYLGFHAEHTETNWTVMKINEDEILFSMTATHDDIDYYDDRAKPTPTRGLFILRPCSASELWDPS